MSLCGLSPATKLHVGTRIDDCNTPIFFTQPQESIPFWTIRLRVGIFSPLNQHSIVGYPTHNIQYLLFIILRKEEIVVFLVLYETKRISQGSTNLPKV